MHITHLGHACVLIEMADTRLIIDPGTFAGDLAGVRDLDAVLVTHQHPDHLDPDRFPGLVAHNRHARVLCDPGSVEVLSGIGVDATAHDGPTQVGSVTESPVGEVHALIHEEIPRIPNVGVRLDAEGEPSFFHPGDALDAEPGEVDVLAFPLEGPRVPGESFPAAEVVVSVETAVREARARRLRPRTEVLLYAVHGILHLRGEDDHDPVRARRCRCGEPLP